MACGTVIAGWGALYRDEGLNSAPQSSRDGGQSLGEPKPPTPGASGRLQREPRWGAAAGGRSGREEGWGPFPSSLGRPQICLSS